MHHPSHWRRWRAARPLLRVVLHPIPCQIRPKSVRATHWVMHPTCRMHWWLHCWSRGAGLPPGPVIRAAKPVPCPVIQPPHGWRWRLHGAGLLLLAVPVGCMVCVCIGVIWVGAPRGITGLMRTIGVRRAPARITMQKE